MSLNKCPHCKEWFTSLPEIFAKHVRTCKKAIFPMEMEFIKQQQYSGMQNMTNEERWAAQAQPYLLFGTAPTKCPRCGK